MIEKNEKYSKEIEKMIKEDVKTLGWFKNIENIVGTEMEFPD